MSAFRRAILMASCCACTVAGAQQTADAPPGVALPAVSQGLLFGAFKVLASDSMEGRRAGSPGGERARNFIVRQLAEIGVQPFVPAYVQKFSGRSQFGSHLMPPYGDGGVLSRGEVETYPWVDGANVLGVVRGTEHPGRFIVVSAHYDHLGVARGAIYSGADDNASGSAGILAIADFIANNPPKNSIIFAWFDAEEEGLLGSNAFVGHLPMKKDSVIADVNLDMVSRSAKEEIFLAGAHHWPVLQPFVDSIDALHVAHIRQGHDSPGSDDWTKRTDSGSFDQEGIPYIHFGVEEHADYHRPTDTILHSQPDFYYNNVLLAAQMVRLIDASADTVRKYKHRQ